MISKNQIVSGFGSAQCVVLQGSPNEAISLSLVVDLPEAYPKLISGIHYSIARNPFFQNSVIASELDLQLFARVTIFRNLTIPLTALFDPFFDVDFTAAGADTDPLSTNFYKYRANYAAEDKVFDLIISNTCFKHHPFTELKFSASDRITAVLTPVYKPFAGASLARQVFGDFYDGRIARTLGLHGCYGY